MDKNKVTVDPAIAEELKQKLSLVAGNFATYEKDIKTANEDLSKQWSGKSGQSYFQAAIKTEILLASIIASFKAIEGSFNAFVKSNIEQDVREAKQISTQDMEA